MPLSEQELRTLEQLEAQLSADDPKFAQTMQSDPEQRRRRRRAVICAVIAVVALAIIVAGGLLKMTWLSLVGILVLAGGAMFALQDLGQQARGGARPQRASAFGPVRADRLNVSGIHTAPSRRSGSTSPFMARLEERWERRRRETQGW